MVKYEGVYTIATVKAAVVLGVGVIIPLIRYKVVKDHKAVAAWAGHYSFSFSKACDSKARAMPMFTSFKVSGGFRQVRTTFLAASMILSRSW